MLLKKRTIKTWSSKDSMDAKLNTKLFVENLVGKSLVTQRWDTASSAKPEKKKVLHYIIMEALFTHGC